MLAEALRLRALGLSVIPVRREDKRPALASWKEFQTRHAAEGEIKAWFQRRPRAGIGIVCGAISQLAVLDFDPRNGVALSHLAPRLPRTPTVETGGGGRHYYFRLSPGERLSKRPKLLPGADLQAEASYVIAPPSVHPSGRRYRWLPGLALGEVRLAPLPLIVRQLVAPQHQRENEETRQTRKLGDSALTLDAVLAALRGVRRCRGGWMALCPAHDDKEPSLSVAGEGGKLLLHCFSGCSFIKILAALRREAA